MLAITNLFGFTFRARPQKDGIHKIFSSAVPFGNTPKGFQQAWILIFYH